MKTFAQPDLLGQALRDFYLKENHDQSFYLNVNHSWKDVMPLDVFFRGEQELSELDAYALEFCKGKILDVGAGSGSISLILQNLGFEVTAIDSSPELAAIMAERGVKKVVRNDIFQFSGKKYDTILMLMNGIGLAGKLSKVPDLIVHLRSLLNEGGQILFDSSDLSYLYTNEEKPADRYFGEIEYQYEYNNRQGNWFSWLYLDPETLKTIVDQEGWKAQILFTEEDQFLARLTFNNKSY